MTRIVFNVQNMLSSSHKNEILSRHSYNVNLQREKLNSFRTISGAHEWTALHLQAADDGRIFVRFCDCRLAEQAQLCCGHIRTHCATEQHPTDQGYEPRVEQILLADVHAQRLALDLEQQETLIGVR